MDWNLDHLSWHLPPSLFWLSTTMSSHWSQVEIGCTHSTKHVIEDTDDTPFKEQFRQIPLPLVEEVHVHLQEMLDSGTICPSQSMWCNAVVLVWKKGWRPTFLQTSDVLMTTQRKTDIHYLGSKKHWNV